MRILMEFLQISKTKFACTVVAVDNSILYILYMYTNQYTKCPTRTLHKICNEALCGFEFKCALSACNTHQSIRNWLNFALN